MSFNIEELAGGAVNESLSKSLEKVLANMQDPNTPWKYSRELVIKLKFTQNEERDDAACDISVTTKLAPVKPLATRFSLGKDLKTGKVVAEEYGHQIKGQMSLDLETDSSKEADDDQEENIIDYRKANNA